MDYFLKKEIKKFKIFVIYGKSITNVVPLNPNIFPNSLLHIKLGTHLVVHPSQYYKGLTSINKILDLNRDKIRKLNFYAEEIFSINSFFDSYGAYSSIYMTEYPNYGYYEHHKEHYQKLNDILKYFLGENYIIPYDLEDRKKMYPKAFDELEPYMRKYLNKKDE